MKYIFKEDLFNGKYVNTNTHYELCVFICYSTEESIDYIKSNTGEDLKWDYYDDDLNYNETVFVVFPTSGFIEHFELELDFIIMD